MKANEQYCLDFGQKNIDPIRCTTCGMLYVVGEESDEKQHAKFHSEFDEGVKWTVKLERPRKYFYDGSRVVAITSNEQKPTLDAINKLLRISDNEMSAGDDVSKLVNKKNSIFLVYITANNSAVGYIHAEIIEEAHILIDFDASRLEEEPVPSECGIIYLWVHPAHRRNKIATHLTDVARANLKKESTIHRSRVALCDPTETAIPFMRAYLLNKRPVKVYQQN